MAALRPQAQAQLDPHKGRLEMLFQKELGWAVDITNLIPQS